MISADVSLDTIDEWPSKTLTGIKKYMREGASVGFSVMLNEMPEDRGTMKQRAFSPEWRQNTLVWGTGAQYAAAQEFGTEAFTPPQRPLREWGERQLGSEDAGMAVWQKIREEGIEPKGFMEAASQAAEETLAGTDATEFINNEL